jgi:hypothetical protein
MRVTDAQEPVAARADRRPKYFRTLNAPVESFISLFDCMIEAL